ncbi:hypothetical protein [Bacillus amyloliquefaciens]|uniref:hypothetical protein n=1 Tax=Bacillus amyloliquefaciens TaxID=1390 RepID=UPI00280759EC|nr:hypothetical protein [Bacillus amyloliquefaciens]MDQ8094895.1 hypothetical protein [Bacillus amyloliquefaciens]
MPSVRGRCTTSVFKVTNVIRGLSGENGNNISLPFSVTVTQFALTGAAFVLSLILQPVLGLILPMEGLIRFVVISIIAPCTFGYIVGSKTKESMNIIQYWLIALQTKREPKEMIGFEEIERFKKVNIKDRILIKRKRFE